MERDTVSMHFVGAAVARLPPAARRRALEAAGIREELLGSPQARVPAQAFSALWLAVARELDDEFFGLDRRRMKVGSFALLCHAVLPSGHLERALRQMLRGFGVFLDDVSAALSLQDGAAVVTLDNRIAIPRRGASPTRPCWSWCTGSPAGSRAGAFRCWPPSSRTRPRRTRRSTR